MYTYNLTSSTSSNSKTVSERLKVQFKFNNLFYVRNVINYFYVTVYITGKLLNIFNLQRCELAQKTNLITRIQ